MSHNEPDLLKSVDDTVLCFDLGVVPYLPVQRLQSRLRQAIGCNRCGSVLLLLEHEPVITLGKRATPETALRLAGTSSPVLTPPPIVRSERGGLATLHAPGQLVSYPVMPLPERNLKKYVYMLEEVLVRLLAHFGIAGHRIPGRPGVYVEDRKIASIGLRCERWVVSHGTALNVDMDLRLFDYIVSCGDPGLKQTDMATVLGSSPSLEAVKQLYAETFALVFRIAVEKPRKVTVEELETALRLREERWGEMPTAGFEPAAPGSGGQCSVP